MENNTFLKTSNFQFVNLFFTLIIILNTVVAFSQTSSCNATINVIKNRNVKSVPSEGISYPINITNNGLSSDTFTLTSLNINNNCSNTDGSSSSNNVILSNDFLDSNSNKINEIFLSVGESKSFIVHVTIPAGTPIGKWNCTQITASSKTCSNYKISTVLHSYVMIPNSDN